MGSGADDYLIKPFSARELMARVFRTSCARAERDYVLHLSKPIELNELAKAIARVSRRV